jgi:pimeloyl-ACP methyl ester carboxylesterase
MSNFQEHTAQMVETSYIETGGVQYAYRRLGAPSEVPIVLLSRLRGTLDDWDPSFVNRLASEQTVIYFDNAGVGLSTGESPDRIAGMAENAAAFIEALSYKQVDLMGFSMGGLVAQQLTVSRPELVRRVVLAGTTPGAGEGTERPLVEALQVAAKPVNTPEDFLYLFFEVSETSQSAGHQYLARLAERKEDRAPRMKPDRVGAQVKALAAWGQQSVYEQLVDIKQPVLVANGSRDIMAPTYNSYLLYQKIPNAQLVLYPDSGHGFLFQYVEAFAQQVLMFLR